MPQRVVSETPNHGVHSSVGVYGVVALTPAFIVALTALFALPQQAGGFRLAKWGVFGLALALVGTALVVRRAPLRFPVRSWPVGLFVALATLLPALSPSLARAHWPTALGLLSGLALFVVTGVALDDDDRARRMSTIVLTASGAMGAVIVLLQAAGLRWLTSDVYTGLEFRAPGTLGNPNWAAAFIAPLVPMSLALAVTAKRRWPHYAIALLLAVATVATLSKGGVLTLAAGVLMFVLMSRGVTRRWRLGLAASAAAGIVLLVAFVWRQEPFATAPWLRGRLFLWRAALFLVSERPLTGVGLGGYVSEYGRAAASVIHGDPLVFMPLSSVDFVHNDLLQLAAEGGLPTVIAFLVLVVSALAYACRRAEPLSVAAGAAIAAIVVNGFADSPLRVPSTFVLLFFLLGWLSPTAVRSSGHRILIAAVVVVGALQGVRFFVGNAYWTLGRDALRAGRPAATYLERARFFLPEHGRSASQHALALAKAGRMDAAIEASTEAAALRFDFDDELFRRDLQARSLERKEAIELWEELASRFPGLVTPQLRLGALYLQANDRAAAVTAFETVLANPQPTARAERARTQARDILRTLLSADLTSP